jgi:hypothetical protein
MRQPINDLDLTRWREYSDILTDSLWLLGPRDNSGAHTPEYWGNFVPQIPRQALLRFTRKGELVLDPFLGLGTTLIECKRLGRWGIGVELVERVAEKARRLVNGEPNPYNVRVEVLTGDSGTAGVCERVVALMRHWGFPHAHLLILHPPYHDIIRFSPLEADLSNAPTEEAFYERFESVLRNFAPLLQDHRFLVLVIGDKYTRGHWIPLGFRTMERVIRHGFALKSICVKDIQENRGKRGQIHLWRYRALKGNFYVFRHEYVMFFQKVSRRG